MPILKRRDRIVVFRLTQDEYKRLEKACSSTGARNLSDYTRRELLDGARAHPPGVHLEGRLFTFDKRLAELQSAVRQIHRTLRRMSGEEIK